MNKYYFKIAVMKVDEGGNDWQLLTHETDIVLSEENNPPDRMWYALDELVKIANSLTDELEKE